MKDSSSDEAEGVAFMEESVTLVQVQQVADAAAASTTFGLEKRFEAKFDAATHDLETLKVNSTEQSLGIKALLLQWACHLKSMGARTCREYSICNLLISPSWNTQVINSRAMQQEACGMPPFTF